MSMRYEARVERAPSRHRAGRGLIALAALVPTLACAGPGDDESARVLATVDGEPVTMADLREVAGEQLDQLDFQYEQQRHQIIEAALTSAVRQRLLDEEAEARGVSVEQLVADEVGPISEVTAAEVESWYEVNSAALGNISLEQIRPQIRMFLQDQRREAALSELIDSMGAEREVRILLSPFRVEFEDVDAPSAGPTDAPITLLEFSDFECPYCGAFFGTLERLKSEYGDRLRIVYRHYPLDNHPNAFQAARASMCAADQGRFWEMHDLLFQEQNRLGNADLREKAERLSLDTAAFDECLASDRHIDTIERDIRAGDRVGVDGTPAVFVNGIPVPGGAAPYDVIAEMIEDELARMNG